MSGAPPLDGDSEAAAADWAAYADDIDAGRDTYTEPEADELAALITYGD